MASEMGFLGISFATAVSHLPKSYALPSAHMLLPWLPPRFCCCCLCRFPLDLVRHPELSAKRGKGMPQANRMSQMIERHKRMIVAC